MHQDVARTCRLPPNLGAESTEAEGGIFLQQQHIAVYDHLDAAESVQAGRLLETLQFGIDAEEVEGMAEDEFPCCDGVEVVEDLVGDLRMNVQQSGAGRAMRDGGNADVW